MNHGELTVEDHVRELPLISDRQAMHEAGSQTRQALFERIVDEPLDDGTSEPLRPRLRRPTVVLVVALGSLSLAAVGWAVSNLLGTTTTTAACHTEGDPHSGTGIDLVTGNPVTDCAAIWEQQTGEVPPELIAYDNGTGGIAVMPADAPVPPGWQPLEEGAAQDPRVIELRMALDDHIAGLPSACHTSGAGLDIAERELERLGLTGWSVITERGEADGTATCTHFHLDPGQPRVVLIPSEGSAAPDDALYVMYARKVGAAISERCLDLAEAAQRAREVADDVGLPGDGLVVNQISDEDAACTRVHVNVFGVIEVALRGPEANP